MSATSQEDLAGDPREATTPTKTERLPDGVRVGRWMIDFVPPPLFAKAGNFTGNVDRWQFATWNPPATVYLDVGCAKTGTGAPEGDRSQGISIWSSHLITPETENSSHYMFCFARDFALGDAEMSRLLLRGLEGHVSRRRGDAGGRPGEPPRRLARRSGRHRRRRRAAAGAADAGPADQRRQRLSNIAMRQPHGGIKHVGTRLAPSARAVGTAMDRRLDFSALADRTRCAAS